MKNFIVCIFRLMQKNRRQSWEGHVDRRDKCRSIFEILADKPTRNSLLGRPKRGWEGYIRTDIKEIGVSTGNWIDLAQDRDCWRVFDIAALSLEVP